MALGPLGQIHVSVTDLARSVAFYRDVLGITLLFEVPGQPMAFFASGDVQLYLGVPENESFRSKSVHYFTVWMAGFTDPDGHQLILMQER